MEKSKKLMGMKIFLHDGTEIMAQDTGFYEDMVIDQISGYANKGYYSRVKQTYYPPSAIKHITLITLE